MALSCKFKVPKQQIYAEIQIKQNKPHKLKNQTELGT